MDPVLVTGTSGLVGYEVADMLHKNGADVLGLDLRPAPAGTEFPCVVGDVGDLPTMMRLLAGRRNIVHSGAASGPMVLPDQPYAVAQANVAGAAAVFEAARLLGVRRLVWTSSIAVYGDRPTLDPVTETEAANPRSFYGYSKVAGEALLRGYIQCYGLSAVALRLSTVYGVRRQTACNLRTLIEAGLRGQHLKVPGEGSCFRQYLHVEDAARAIVAALAAETVPSFAYNVTGGTYISEAELALKIQRLLPRLQVEFGAPAWNEGRIGPLVMDAIEREIGYVPQRSLDDGLVELVAHLAQVDQTDR